MAARRKTATSNFGVGRREAHDATGFYARFTPPNVSDAADVAPAAPVPEPFVCGDARHMDGWVEDNSVALVVTSPPYFAGKQYEEELDRDGIPSSYAEYLELLHDVFKECARKLEPGGRIAVNVANLGRKPYRSLSGDVIDILQKLGLLLRGEVIWQKGEGAAGNCAWGSFRSPANPVLRDITERVVIASKDRFDRALTVSERKALGLPHENTVNSDEFMAATLDVWDILPESASRVGHPAPFPVELPERLIRLYTYDGDLVLDPFMGAGSSLVAAAKLNRRYVGFDLDPAYVDIARQRVHAAKTGDDADFQARASQEGKAAQGIAQSVLEAAGFTIVAKNQRPRGTGLTINFIAQDAQGVDWHFDVTGAFTTTRGGLLKTDTVFKSLGRALVLDKKDIRPVVFLTSHLPRRASEGDKALRAAGPKAFHDAIEMLSDEGRARLAAYAAGGHHHQALPGFWTEQEIEQAR